jgi:hypothetical protein
MPCSPLKVNQRFGGTYRLHIQGKRSKLCLPPAFMLVSCSVYSPTLKMEATCSSETSVDFQRTTWCYIPEDSTLCNHCCEWEPQILHCGIRRRVMNEREVEWRLAKLCTFETNLVSGMRRYNAGILYGTSYFYLCALLVMYCSVSQFNFTMECFRTQKPFRNPHKILTYEAIN